MFLAGGDAAGGLGSFDGDEEGPEREAAADPEEAERSIRSRLDSRSREAPASHLLCLICRQCSVFMRPKPSMCDLNRTAAHSGARPGSDVLPTTPVAEWFR